MLAFSNVLSQYGGYLKENAPVVITGRLSIRDEKEPQIVINRARPMSDFEGRVVEEEKPAAPVANTLYLRVASETDPNFRKVKAIVNMFPGKDTVKVMFADTRKLVGAQAAFDMRMIQELKNLLGAENVVLK